MESGRRKRRARRVSSDEVVDLSVHSTRPDSTDPIRLDSEDGAVGNDASTSVAIVDLTKDNDSSILSNDVVDLTDNTMLEDIVEVTPPKRTRRRRRSAQQHGSGNSVVISSGEESDDNDLVVLGTPSPTPQDVLSSRFDALTATPSPSKKEIKCPVCLDSDTAIKRNGRRLMSTNCGHVFCEECIKQSITSQHKCPTCRHRLTMRQIHPLFL